MHSVIQNVGIKIYTFTEITCNGSQIFIVCVVGVWRHILNLWCVCVCVTSCTHTPQVIITNNFSESTDYHSLMMDPLWSKTCGCNF